MSRIGNAWRALRGASGVETKGFLTSEEAFAIFGAINTASGISISAEVALRVPAVLSATRAISEAVGQLPLTLYRRSANGTKKALAPSEHPVARVLERPAPWIGDTEFRRQMQADVLLHGNAYAVVVKVNGEPRELHRIDPRLVSVTYDIFTAEPHYRIGIATDGAREYSWSEVLHLRALGTNGAIGIGILTLAKEAIALALILETHAAKLFSRGAKPSGVLETPKVLSPKVVKQLRESFEAAHSGAEQSGNTLVLEEGMKFTSTQLTSVDSQFLQLREFSILEIARACRVPPHMVGALDKTTHSNVEELGSQFLTFTLAPWLAIWEDAIERTLIDPAEQDELCAEFDTIGIARADIEKRMAAYQSGIQSGVLLLNEARALEGLPPVEGGDTPMRSVQVEPLTAINPSTEVVPPAMLPAPSKLRAAA